MKARALVAELLGTFGLTFFAAGGDVIASLSPGQVPYPVKWAAPGLLVMAMIYSIGDISGAHINPAVTLAFAVRKSFPWKMVPFYWVVQLVGAILAALLLAALFGTMGHLGANRPHHGTGAAFLTEVVLTWLLVTVILSTAQGHRLVGPNAGIAVGGTIALAGLIFGPISGASMNPARSLGPAIVSGSLGDAWLYVLAPAVGALAAAGIVWLLRGDPNAHEEDAATGERKAS